MKLTLLLLLMSICSFAQPTPIGVLVPVPAYLPNYNPGVNLKSDTLKIELNKWEIDLIMEFERTIEYFKTKHIDKMIADISIVKNLYLESIIVDRNVDLKKVKYGFKDGKIIIVKQ